MTFHDTLLAETASAREAFLAIPLVRRATDGGVDRAVYLRYLEQAYHHVRHTCALLALAASRCGPEDRALQAALFNYIVEENGHDEWILEDIAALGGDADAVRDRTADAPARIMVGYAYYAVDHISPYALLGMVHVLECMSVALADKAARAIGRAIGAEDGKGFRYLTSHGALDRDHIRFFETLFNGIGDPHAREAVIDTANIMYRLFGDIFRALDTTTKETRDAT